MSNNFSLRLSIMILATLTLLGSIVYAGINAYLYFYQRSMIYHPVVEMAAPSNYGMYDTQLVKLKTADNLEIVSWYRVPKRGQPVMLYLHGNAGNLGDRAEKLKVFIGKGMGMMAVSWRGFGGSQGYPTEDGLYNDARAAIKYLLDNGVALNDIFLYGESLGSGVAVQMATEFKVRALVLEAPYTSISSRAAELYPYIPVKLLLKDHFQSIDKIGSVHVPVLIFHGYLDQVMPISHGRRMIMAANEPKEMRVFEHTGHTDFNFNEISQIAYDFVSKVGN
jgi:pimeloyl-ACP methyl ester carboxylesterase